MPTSFISRKISCRTALVSLTIAGALGFGAPSSSAVDGKLRALPASSRGTAHNAEAHALVPPQNPTSNVVPTSAMNDNCLAPSPTPSQVSECDRETLSAIDTALASEGVGPMTLPRGYEQMPAIEQILVVSNLERIDRGLAPAQGLSSSLDAFALQGARNNTDPPFPNPFYGASGGSNWASTSSALFADFLFMYDDGPGPGGINIDCTASNPSGCWGHRDNILGNYDQPLLLGAATVPGSSLTEEFIGGDRVDSADVTTWSSVAPLLPLAVTPSAVTLRATPGSPKSSIVTVSDSGVAMNITANITPATSEWSLAPYHCNLQPGNSCSLTLHLAPTPGGVTSATLRVTGPDGTIDVALNALSVRGPPGAPTRVVAHANGPRVRVSWTAPHSDGGAMVSYRVYSTPAGLRCTTNTTSCVMVHRRGRGSYVFSVVARNAIGVSEHSTSSNRVAVR